MPSWTKEQELAINKSNTNIIVSAGAGSGKTAVLTERVITKLLNGVKINNLLILTFTNAAASEMKERIRKKILEHEEIKDNLNYLDIASITTFDSYALSLVKKYHYLLNVSSNINIADTGFINVIKKDILDKVMDEKYAEKDSKFCKLIDDLTIKNDNNIKESILKIINGLELKIDKENYLDNYFNNYYNEEKIEEYINEYTLLIKNEINNIETNIECLEGLGYDQYYVDMYNTFSMFLNALTYDEMRISIPSNIPKRPKYSIELEEYKKNIDASLKIIKEYLRFNNTKEIKETFNLTKDYLESIIDIIKRYYLKLNKYKYDNNIYEFTDIMFLLIKLLKENRDIKEEIKNNISEICIDEYQDNNDLQEELISLISNNNVYMVGDIKQSIYGFRNANPYIFKNKYDKYKDNNGGVKIDLLKNFRSRKEVLEGINKIFSFIMDDNLGGIDYKDNQEMIFGNNVYEENKNNQNYDLEIYNYQDNKDYTKEEIEAFIIGKDILNKINNKYQVLDNNTLRDVTYKDFCIIMDRGTSFSLFKKIFNYLGIPLTIYKDKKLTNEIDIMLINNIIGLILKINNNIFDQEFKYYFLSIGRSYLFELKDNELFNIIKNNSYEDTIIYNKCISICNNIDRLNIYELLIKIIDEFNIYENTIKVGNIEESIIRINNLLDIANNLGKLGYSIEDFKDYLNKMINEKEEITYKDSLISFNSVKIMNIHKSKGLEFPICYYSLLYKEFNKDDIKRKYTYDNKYGIIVPYFNEGIDNTILKDLLKNKVNIDSIGEKIRLFYVALTRSKEKIILLTNLDDNYNYVNNIVDYNIRIKYNSFLDIINSIKDNLKEYINNIDINNIGITKDYLYDNNKKDININTDKIINYHNININNEIIDNLHASKIINKIITKNEKELLDYGTKIHKLFEREDFLNSDNDIIKKFVSKLNINNNTLIYKEHEFIYNDNINEYHGIIDLLLIEDNIIKIIDYKLKNIDDDSYKEQLNIYYNYINNVLNKDSDKIIKVYLYSILDDNLKEIVF